MKYQFLIRRVGLLMIPCLIMASTPAEAFSPLTQKVAETPLNSLASDQIQITALAAPCLSIISLYFVGRTHNINFGAILQTSWSELIQSAERHWISGLLILVATAAIAYLTYKNQYLKKQNSTKDGLIREARIRINTLLKQLELNRTESANLQNQLVSKEMEIEKLTREGYTDSLTGLLNRRGWAISFEREVKRAQRLDYGGQTQSQLSMILFDIDEFKKINDTSGHQEGDRVLREIASVLNHHLKRGMDIVARFGGDEFVILLPDTTLEDAARIAEKIRADIEARVRASEGVKVTVSAGVATYDQGDTDFFKKVDHMLYAAKNRGRNQVAADLPPKLTVKNLSKAIRGMLDRRDPKAVKTPHQQAA